jgi:hypothetical protein
MTNLPKTTWFNYAPLTGAGGKLEDDGSRVFCSIPIEQKDGKALEVAIIGDATRLELIRVATPNSDGNLSEQERYQVARATDHAIAVIRLRPQYRTDASRSRSASFDWTSQ